MTEFNLTMMLDVTGPTGGVSLEQQVGAVMEHLIQLSGPDRDVDDPAVSLDLGANEVLVELVVRADDLDAATDLASVAIRTAVHAAGGGTPDWSKTSQRVELV